MDGKSAFVTWSCGREPPFLFSALYVQLIETLELIALNTPGVFLDQKTRDEGTDKS